MYRPYDKNVLVGNWFEDRALEEVIIVINMYSRRNTLTYVHLNLKDVIKDYLDKRSKGDLLSQKVHNGSNSQVRNKIFFQNCNLQNLEKLNCRFH